VANFGTWWKFVYLNEKIWKDIHSRIFNIKISKYDMCNDLIKEIARIGA